MGTAGHFGVPSNGRVHAAIDACNRRIYADYHVHQPQLFTCASRLSGVLSDRVDACLQFVHGVRVRIVDTALGEASACRAHTLVADGQLTGKSDCIRARTCPPRVASIRCASCARRPNTQVHRCRSHAQSVRAARRGACVVRATQHTLCAICTSSSGQSVRAHTSATSYT